MAEIESLYKSRIKKVQFCDKRFFDKC